MRMVWARDISAFRALNIQINRAAIVIVRMPPRMGDGGIHAGVRHMTMRHWPHGHDSHQPKE